MCGIYGVMHFDGSPVEPSTLATMARRMVHRGPDDEGNWISGHVGLGMRRLSIIDLEGSRQPISNETGEIHIVLNGEIYNYRELRKELVERGHHFKTHGDVEVVLHLYEELGTNCLARLNGMFALAIHDQRNGQLWLARDRLGIKPLYYCHFERGLAFASDLNSLADAMGAELDPDGVIRYLGNSYVPEPHTIFKGLRKLEIASQLLVRREGVENSRYWRLEDEPPWEGSAETARERLEELLLDAAELQLRSDVPVGVFLSGGVDSSAVAALAAKVNGAEAVRTFTIDFIGKGGEDAEYAEMVARKIGSDHERIPIDAEAQMEALEELIAILDEPMSDSAIVPTYILSREARKRGVKVLLSGAGGDEIFGGYSRHHTGRVGSAAWIAHHGWARTPFRLLAQLRKPHWSTRFATPARNFGVMVSGANLLFLRQALRDHRDYDGMLDAFEQDFAPAREPGLVPRMRLDLDNYLPNDVLALTDKATMAASVEGRVPLLDHRVVAFAHNLPPEINLLGGGEKGLFKRMLESYLPPPVLIRGKEGFNAPMNSWVERSPETIHNELSSRLHPMLEELVDGRVMSAWLASPRKRGTAGDSLYALYLLNCWLRMRK